jgi:hypothetical protein
MPFRRTSDEDSPVVGIQTGAYATPEFFDLKGQWMMIMMMMIIMVMRRRRRRRERRRGRKAMVVVMRW